MIFANPICYGQGQVLFKTFDSVTATGDARAFMDYGKTIPCSGTNFLAQLYAADGTNVIMADLIPVGSPVSLLTGDTAGYVSAGSVQVTAMTGPYGTGGLNDAPADNPEGIVSLQIRVWDANYSTYEEARGNYAASGPSAIFRVIPTFLPSSPDDAGLSQLGKPDFRVLAIQLPPFPPGFQPPSSSQKKQANQGMTQMDAGVNNPTPNITLNTPAAQMNLAPGYSYTFSWQTTCTSTSAVIALYLDADGNLGSGVIPIATGIPNNGATSYTWVANPALAGTNYYVYAMMTDGVNSSGNFAPGRMQIEPIGTFQLLSGVVVTNASYAWQYSYNGTTYTGTSQLVLGANVVSVTNGTVIHQFIVTRVPSSAQVDAVQYNPLNQVSTITNGNGIVTTLIYDPLGRLVRRQSSNGALVTYGYDVLGNRTNMTDCTGTTFYRYDGLNRITNVTTSAGGVLGAGDNLSLSYEYDLAGNKTAVVYPGGERIQYTNDNAGRLVAVYNVTRNLLFQYYYNPANGQLTRLTRPNGIETDYKYDNMGRVTNILHQVTRTGALVAQYGYILDAIGKAKLLTTTLPGSVTKLEQYNYDYSDRLTNVIYGDYGVISASALNVTYAYDGNGNRLTMTTKTNNAVTEIRSYVYGNENRLLLVTNQNGALIANYFYDSAGNRLQKVGPGNTVLYGYDERNLMTGYSDKTNVIAYAYNGDAQRVSKTLNAVSTTYVIDANRSPFEVAQERNGSGAITTSCTFGLARLATWNGSAVTFDLTDRLGSVRLLTDANGNVIQRLNYDVFGATR